MRNEDISPELARLVAEHPASFRGTVPVIDSYLSVGWYRLVDRLCTDIESVLGPDIKHFECLQIKEKFGVLRFYWSYKTMAEIHVDVLGPAEMVTFSREPSFADERLLRVRQLVDAATELSESTCETCGAPGRLRVRHGHYTTRCREHA